MGSGRRRTTVSTAVDSDSGEPPPPSSLAAARQSMADNGRWLAESWWEAELFTTNKPIGASPGRDYVLMGMVLQII